LIRIKAGLLAAMPGWQAMQSRWEEDDLNWKRKKKPLMGLVGGAGVVAFLIAVPGGFYSVTTGIVVAASIWIVGATLVKVLAL
jgi:hypothetical protein